MWDSKAGRLILVVLFIGVGLTIGFFVFGWGRVQQPPPPGGPALVSYLDSLHVEPVADLASDIAPGMVLTFDDEGRYAVYATAGEVLGTDAPPAPEVTPVQAEAEYIDQLDLTASTGTILDVIPGLASASAQLESNAISRVRTRLRNMEKRYLSTRTLETLVRESGVEAELRAGRNAAVVQAVYSPEHLEVQFERSATIEGSLSLDAQELGEVASAAGATVSGEGTITWAAPVLGFHRLVAIETPPGGTDQEITAVVADLSRRGLDTERAGNVLLVDPGRSTPQVAAASARDALKARRLTSEIEVFRLTSSDLQLAHLDAKEQLEQAQQLAATRARAIEQLQGRLTAMREHVIRLEGGAVDLRRRIGALRIPEKESLLQDLTRLDGTIGVIKRDARRRQP